jgi:hypothetical protein
VRMDHVRSLTSHCTPNRTHGPRNPVDPPLDLREPRHRNIWKARDRVSCRDHRDVCPFRKETVRQRGNDALGAAVRQILDHLQDPELRAVRRITARHLPTSSS